MSTFRAAAGLLVLRQWLIGLTNVTASELPHNYYV